MPLIPSAYRASNYFLSGHLQTILPALFRKLPEVRYRRERINTPDKDFLDLDWYINGSDHLAILCHGLEGNTQTQYMLGMARALHLHGWDVLAWNYRGCSGEINRQHRFYHSGETGDLDTIIRHALTIKNYREVVLIGFSVGGNIALKYLGEQGIKLHPAIVKSVVFSVPCHLASAAAHLAGSGNKIYMRRFLKSLRRKVQAKSALMPHLINDHGFSSIRNFYQFDEKYTAPIHGFKNAHDYWQKNSSIHFIEKISIPTLIVNAENDPFLSPECFPVKEAGKNLHVFLEVPKGGGHCGFYEHNKDGLYWSEKRTLEFIN